MKPNPGWVQYTRKVTMSITKDETTTRLDVFTSLAAETLEFYERVHDYIEDEAAGSGLSTHLDTQRRLLDNVKADQRARGGLPQEGDPERAQLHGLYVRLSAAVRSGGGDALILEAVVNAATELAESADAVLECDIPPDQAELLTAFKTDCNALVDVMRGRASRRSDR